MPAMSLSSFSLLNSTDNNIKILVTFNNQTYLLGLGEIKNLISKEGIGLGSVDNTSDINKPLSNAIITALQGKSPLGHTHTPGEIVGLSDIISQLALEGVNVAILEW